MSAPTTEQVQYFREILLPTYREFETALYTFMAGSTEDAELKRRFLAASWATSHFVDLVTDKDHCKLLTLEHTELGLRILRRVLADLDYSKLCVSTQAILGDELLEDTTISELLKSIPQLRVLVNVAEEGEMQDVLEVDLFACLGACVEFWQNALGLGVE